MDSARGSAAFRPAPSSLAGDVRVCIIFSPFPLPRDDGDHDLSGACSRAVRGRLVQVPLARVAEAAAAPGRLLQCLLPQSLEVARQRRWSLPHLAASEWATAQGDPLALPAV